VAVFDLSLQASDLQGETLMGLKKHICEVSAFSVDMTPHCLNMPRVKRLPNLLNIIALPPDQHIS
jgi:hypothetical protein